MNEVKIAMNFKNNHANWNSSITVLITLNENAKTNPKNALQ